MLKGPLASIMWTSHLVILGVEFRGWLARLCEKNSRTIFGVVWLYENADYHSFIHSLCHFHIVKRGGSVLRLDSYTVQEQYMAELSLRNTTACSQ